jgi:hypothetical protein
MQDNELDLESAMELLKSIVKESTALDKARHFDLTLAPSHERDKYLAALKRVQKAIRLKEVAQDYIEKRTTLKI